MSTLFWVALGSAIGAPTRYLLDQFIQSRHERIFPWGTFTINVTGSFLLGLLIAASTRNDVGTWFLASAGTGFLGSYTTFSTFTWEAMRLIEEGAFLVGSLNIAASIITGEGAAAAGLFLGTML